jgi:hypothetical protein
MKCKHIGDLIDRWQDGNSVSHSEIREIQMHITNCKICASKYTSFIPLLERDNDPSFVLDPHEEIPLFKTADRVMERINRQKIHSLTDLRRTGLAFAAVVFTVLLGVLLYTTVWMPRGDMVAVRFVLSVPGARSVSLVGDFTDWDTSRFMLKDIDGDGVWEIEIKLNKGVSYKYNFLIDEETWITDPNSLIQVNDGFGGESSIMAL